MTDKLTPQEQWLRGALAVLSLVFIASIVIYLGRGWGGHADYAFVANSVTKDVFFLIFSVLVIANVRRFGWLTSLVIIGHVLLMLALLSMIGFHKTGKLTSIETLFGLGHTEFAWVWLLLDAFIAIELTGVYTAARRSRLPGRYLWPIQYQTVRALSEVLIPDEGRQITPDRIAVNVDDYLGNFDAKGKWKVKLGVMPLAWFALLAPGTRRRWLEKMTDGEGFFFRALGRALQSLIGVGAQLVYFGYYGDPSSFKSIGYKPFKDRSAYAVRMVHVDPARPRLVSLDPNQVTPNELVADHVIVGSGAGGAILAYELAARGRSVLVLERGKHVDPSQFSDIETNMLSALYSDGAIQVSRDTRFAVLQGMCVGGSTVVNNAVCIRAPDDVLNNWVNPSGLNAGIDLDKLRASYDHIEKWLRVRQQSHRVFSRGAEKFLEGVDALHLQDRVHVVKANIVDCLGCGYCNIGCKYGKKLSMLDTVLPWSQDRFPGKVRVLPNCYAKRIEMDGPRAASVLCEVGKDGKKRTMHVRARESIVVSAGAINSSLLLRRSRIRMSVAGKGLAFNMGTPVTADFGDKLDSYDGLQISHYFDPPDGAGYVVETWFNPPAMQSLFMPGWCQKHYDNMDNYDRMASAGVVVGTKSNGNVRRGVLGNFGFDPEPQDLETIVKGVKQLTAIFRAAGAKRVMPATFRYRSFPPDKLEVLDDYVKDRTGISLNSSHPQGGNAISETADKGVVDPDFKVHGTANLYVCDASVFPSSITVNPQYTVMALAHYAATKISGEELPKRERHPAEGRFGNPPSRAPGELRVPA